MKISAIVQKILSLIFWISYFPAQAQIILNESFYDLEEGWQVSGDRIENGAGVKLEKDSLTYKSLLSAGGHLSLAPINDNAPLQYHRPLGEDIAKGTVWLSFLFMCPKNIEQGIFAFDLQDRNHANSGTIGVFGLGKKIGKAFSLGNRGITNVAAENKRVYHFVARYDLSKGVRKVTLWIDPSLDRQPNATSASFQLERLENYEAINHLRIYSRGKKPGPYHFDEIKIGRKWSDIISVPSGPTKGKFEVASNTVAGSFYASLQFSNPVRGLNSESFEVTNGTVEKVYGFSRAYSILVNPKKAGAVSLKLRPNRTWALASNTKTSAQMEPVILQETQVRKQAPEFKLGGIQKDLQSSRSYCDWTSGNITLRVGNCWLPEAWNQVAITKILNGFEQVSDSLAQLTGSADSRSSERITIDFTTDPAKLNRRLQKKNQIVVPLSEFADLYESAKAGVIIYPSDILLKMGAGALKRAGFRGKIDYSVMRDKSRKSTWWHDAILKVAILQICGEKTIKTDLNSAKSRRAFKRYLANPNYKWYGSFDSVSPKWDPTLKLNELMSGLLLHLLNQRDDEKLLGKIIGEIIQMEPMKSISNKTAARDKFAIAVSRALGEDLSDYFSKSLKWPVTNKVSRALQNK